MNLIEKFRGNVSGDEKSKEVLVEKFEHILKFDEKYFKEPSPEFMSFFNERLQKIYGFLVPSILEIPLGKKPKVLISSQENIPPSYFDVKIGAIIIDENSMKDKEELGLNITHEIIHFLSAQNIYVTEKKENSMAIVFKKVGYSADHFNFNESDSENFKSLGEAFNEGLTEYLASSIYYNFDNSKMKVSYPYEVRLVRKIINRLDINNDEDDNFIKIYQGYFNGRNMHLREIEKYYGPGSLRLLFEIKTLDNIKKEANGDKNKFVEYFDRRMESLEFFITDDEKRREELRIKLLGKDQ